MKGKRDDVTPDAREESTDEEATVVGHERSSNAENDICNESGDEGGSTPNPVRHIAP